MTTILSDNLNPANAPSNTGTLVPKNGISPLQDGTSFGQFMSEMFQIQLDSPQEVVASEMGTAEPKGQEVADPLALENTVAISYIHAWPPLKAMTLGPHLNVLTPETSAPDAQSLEAFARAQGLDEKAVHWLFNGGGEPYLGGTTTDKAIASLPGSALIGLQALRATSEESVQPSKTSTLATTIAEEALPVQMLRMPPPAAVWIQRSGMNSSLQDKMNAPKESTVSTTALDLGPDWGGEILQELLGAEASSNASSNSTGTHGNAYANFASRWDALASARNELNHTHNPAQDLPDTPSRSENIQNLADKMGQAVGQRILSEMERGQWHLKLQLRPATLGHIEVEMRLRSGEFDAIFTAPNAITRDLLQDGLGKLRETLAQMGMDVANIHVGDGQTGQSGGDSTPGTPKGKTSQMATSPLASTAETPRTPSLKDPRDGLDILV